MTRKMNLPYGMVPRNLGTPREMPLARRQNATNERKSKNESEPKQRVNVKAARKDEGLMVSPVRNFAGWNGTNFTSRFGSV